MKGTRLWNPLAVQSPPENLLILRRIPFSDYSIFLANHTQVFWRTNESMYLYHQRSLLHTILNSSYQVEWDALVKYIYDSSIRSTASRGNKPLTALHAWDYQVVKCCRLQQILMLVSDRNFGHSLNADAAPLRSVGEERERIPQTGQAHCPVCCLNKVPLPKTPILEVQLWKQIEEQILISQ